MRKRALWLMLAAAFLYGPSLKGEFLWDDRAHVPDRPEVYTLAGLRQIWTSPGFVQQYYPLTFSTVWVEHRFFGPKPLGYHIVTLVFHALNGVLVAFLLMELGIPAAWWVGFLFVLHPLQVESVAWISELKNTQSTFFALLSLICFWRSRKRNGPLTILSFVFFVAALFSKTTMSVLPVVMAIMIFDHDHRLSRRDVFQLIAYFITAFPLGLATAHWEKTLIGAAGQEWNHTLWERLLIAGRAWWFYLGKLAWPSPLMFFYPKWVTGTSLVNGALFVGAALWMAGLWFFRHRFGNKPFLAFLAYSAILSPALGFFAIYPMRYSFVADHFQYAACIPILALAAAGILRLRWGKVLLTMACLVLADQSMKHMEAFQNPYALWQDTLRKNPSCIPAYLNLAYEYTQHGLIVEAEATLNQAERLKPHDFDVQLRLGSFAMTVQHRLPEARDHFQKALQSLELVSSTHVKEGNQMILHYYLLQSCMAMNLQAEAIDHGRQTLRLLDHLRDRTYFDITPDSIVAITKDTRERLHQLGTEY